MTEPNDVVRAFPKGADLPENPLTITQPAPGRYCQHDSVSLDTHTRTVVCRTCFATLEPFSFLLTNARVIGRAWDDHRAVQRQVAELAERVTVLKREEARLRARVKRAQERNLGPILSKTAPDGVQP